MVFRRTMSARSFLYGRADFFYVAEEKSVGRLRAITERLQMNIIELLLTALVLSADAFAVSMCKGLSEKRLSSNTIYPSGCGSEVFRR